MLIFFAVLAVVRGQLVLAQHNALMDVYRGLACNSSVCPRFGANETCIGIGIQCVQGQLVTLDLRGQGLSGTISASIGQLTALEEISLQVNQLNGTLPTTLNQLNALTRLYLSMNRFHGILPPFDQMPLLTSLSLSLNKYSGSVFSVVIQLTTLETLALDDNNFAGTIPNNILLLSALRQLSLSYNNFGGTIPATIGRLSALETLSASGTLLSGTIPTTIAQLTKLVSLFLNENSLIGKVPTLPPNISQCILQYAHSDTNCLDCSTVQGKCMAHCGACQTTTSISRTTTSRTSTGRTSTTTSTSTVPTGMTMAPFQPPSQSSVFFSTDAPTEASISFAPTSTNFDVLTESTTLTTSETSFSSLSATGEMTTAAESVESSNAIDITMIGGIVGGSVGLLLIIALIVCLVVRYRGNKAKDDKTAASQSDSGINMESARESIRQSQNQYGPLTPLQPPKGSYASLSPETTYDDPTILNSRNYQSFVRPTDYESGNLGD